MEALKRLEEIKRTIDILAAESEKRSSYSLKFKNAIRTAIQNRGIVAKTSFIDENYKSAHKAIKAATSATGTGNVAYTSRYLAYSKYSNVIQDFITIVPSNNNTDVKLNTIFTDTIQNANIVQENENKPVSNLTFLSRNDTFKKVVIAEKITDEALKLLDGEEVLNFLELYLALRIEDAIHDLIIANIFTNSETYDGSSHAGLVPNPTWVDAVSLMIEYARRENYYLSPRVKSEVDGLILKQNYFELLPVTKDTNGRRLFNDFNEAFGDIVTFKFNFDAQGIDAAVIRTKEFILYVSDLFVTLKDDQPLENTYLLIAEMYVAFVSTPRYVANQLNHAFVGNIPTIIDNIKQV